MQVRQAVQSSTTQSTSVMQRLSNNASKASNPILLHKLKHHRLPKEIYRRRTPLATIDRERQTSTLPGVVLLNAPFSVSTFGVAFNCLGGYLCQKIDGHPPASTPLEAVVQLHYAFISKRVFVSLYSKHQSLFFGFSVVCSGPVSLPPPHWLDQK